MPNGSSCPSSPYVWTPALLDWSSKFSVSGDPAATVSPRLLQSTDPAGTYGWTVTFTNSAGQTVTKSFTVVYTLIPATTLSFTGLSPNSFTTGTTGYKAVTTASGSNFTNVTKVAFSWSGATSGTRTWNKGDSNWTSKVLVNSDGSMTLSPTVTSVGDPVGLTTWMVTLTDSSNATASKTFTVNYAP